MIAADPPQGRRRIDLRMGKVSRKYHLGVTGILYVGVTVFLSFGAVNSQNNLLFIAFGLALGGLLVSGVVSGSTLMNIEVERQAPARGVVGEAMVIRYRVKNRGRVFPAFGLTIREVGTGEGKGRRRHGWRSWLSSEPRAFVIMAGPKEIVHAEAAVAPRRRGPLRFETYQVSTRFTFGVVTKSVTWKSTATVLVHPEPLAAPEHVMKSAIALSMDAWGDRPRVGRSDEYLGLREYEPGDSIRQVAWRATARRGELVVREQASPSPRRVWVAVDLAPIRSAEGEARERLEAANERALSLAAGVIDRLAREDAEVGLMIPGSGVRRPPAALGGPTSGRRGQLMDDLARVDLELVDESNGASALGGGRAAWIIVHAGSSKSRLTAPGAAHLRADEREFDEIPAPVEPPPRSRQEEQGAAA
ncbi:MAG: DUF58 domain-containing protein [Planctomycetota bacterium]|nr:DUF58 domain-containing protein [Planctomycetota bacterium]